MRDLGYTQLDRVQPCSSLAYIVEGVASWGQNSSISSGQCAVRRPEASTYLATMGHIDE